MCQKNGVPLRQKVERKAKLGQQSTRIPRQGFCLQTKLGMNSARKRIKFAGRGTLHTGGMKKDIALLRPCVSDRPAGAAWVHARVTTTGLIGMTPVLSCRVKGERTYGSDREWHRFRWATQTPKELKQTWRNKTSWRKMFYGAMGHIMPR